MLEQTHGTPHSIPIISSLAALDKEAPQLPMADFDSFRLRMARGSTLYYTL